MRFIAPLFVACALLSPIGVGAMDRADAELVLDQLFARYPVEPLEAPVFETAENGRVEVVLPVLRQDVGGLKRAEHMLLEDAHLEMGAADGATVWIQVTLPDAAMLRDRAEEPVYHVAYGAHHIRLLWDTRNGEPAGLDAEMDRFELSMIDNERSRLSATDLSLSWSDFQVEAALGGIRLTDVPGARELRGRAARIALSRDESNDRAQQLDAALEAYRFGLPLAPRDLEISTRAEGSDWSDVNALMANAIDHILSGESPTTAFTEANRAMWRLFKRDRTRFEIDHLHVGSPMAEVEGRGIAAFDPGARRGGTADLDLVLFDVGTLRSFIGTPESPTLFGLLMMDLVHAVNLGRVGEEGTEYNLIVGADGAVRVNDSVIYD